MPEPTPDLRQMDPIELLTELVSIASPSREEAAAAAHLVAWMTAQGMDAHVDDAGNAVGIQGDADAAKEILLLGHIDTFPGVVPVRREGDLFYGRGSVDAKGPLCAFAAAAAQLSPPPGWRIRVVGAVEEESATSKGARFIGAHTATPPACCVIGEPSRWDRITLGYKGRLLLHLTLRLPFAHSAGQESLPAERAVALWQHILHHCQQGDQSREAMRPFDQLTPSLRSIQSRDDGAFGEVDLQLGFRLPPGLPPDAVEASLWEVICHSLWGEEAPTEAAITRHNPAGAPPTARYHKDADDITVEATFSGGEHAHKGNKSNPLVRSFLGAIRAHEGKPRFVVKTGTCDLNVLAPLWPETPFVAYGPGDSSLDHTPHEHIDLNEYVQAIDVLQAMLQRLWR